MTDNTPSWLKQVQTAKEEVPDWLSQVVTHPKFSALHRRETSWELFSTDEEHLEDPELREVCRQFMAHYA